MHEVLTLAAATGHELFAQLADSSSPMLQLGIAGAMLAWFMFRLEPRMNGMEDAVRELSRSILLDLVSRPGANPIVKTEANEMLERLGSKPPFKRR